MIKDNTREFSGTNSYKGLVCCNKRYSSLNHKTLHLIVTDFDHRESMWHADYWDSKCKWLHTTNEECKRVLQHIPWMVLVEGDTFILDTGDRYK